MRKRVIGSKFTEAIGPDGIEAFSVYVKTFSIPGLSFVNEANNANLAWFWEVVKRMQCLGR